MPICCKTNLKDVTMNDVTITQMNFVTKDLLKHSQVFLNN